MFHVKKYDVNQNSISSVNSEYQLPINISYRNRMWVCGLDSCGSGKVPTVDTTEHDNELSGAIKFREIFD